MLPSPFLSLQPALCEYHFICSLSAALHLHIFLHVSAALTCMYFTAFIFLSIFLTLSPVCFSEVIFTALYVYQGAFSALEFCMLRPGAKYLLCACFLESCYS